MAVHTGKKNLMHAPGVVIAKKKRESISEADHPDQTLASANKFTDKSFLKKVAAIQDSSKRPLPFPSHTHPDHFTRPQTVESLKSVGVDSTRR
ncbi:hypothetical protein COLO4_08097 [Corchorus olitorius]|uniref:Uncharacterized protein n=1 Tax=Corchorus olitorius TaxID=93759 RepID=A0A1R3KHF8_9ROSI|nr:hypothetical protein COLO4_08097 [Corchorus olitorius]